MSTNRLLVSLVLLLFFGTSCILGWPLPKNVCKSPIDLVSTSKPTTVVGTGTAVSCNESALAAALAIGGIVTFNCGNQPATILITKQLNISRTTDTTIDGNGLVTLDGTGQTRILNFDRGDFRYSNITLTVQRLRFINGYCQDLEGGCAIFQKNGGTTIVINCIFENNTGPVIGQDTAGGAIWTIGGGNSTVVGSVFMQNKCSNGGAIGILGSGLLIYNSHFESNQATGNGGNPGNGGNGGAISFDGRGRINTICGTRFTKNQGNKFGGAFFRVSYNGDEQNNLSYLLIDSNFIPANGNGLAGGLYIQGGTAMIESTTIVNNSATASGGIFFSNEKSVVLNNVNLLENQAYTGLGAAVYCSNPVSGTFTGFTVANNYAGAFGAAFSSCNTEVTLSQSIIANNTVGNVWPANACTTTMNGGTNVIQSPIKKLPPAQYEDASCTNRGLTKIDNVSVVLDRQTWKIKVTGAQPSFVGPNIVPGL